MLENKQQGNSRTWNISYKVQERKIKDPLVCIRTTVTGGPCPFLFIFHTITTVSGSKKIPKCKFAAKEFLKPSYIRHLGATVFTLLLAYLASQTSTVARCNHCMKNNVAARQFSLSEPTRVVRLMNRKCMMSKYIQRSLLTQYIMYK